MPNKRSIRRHAGDTELDLPPTLQNTSTTTLPKNPKKKKRTKLNTTKPPPNYDDASKTGTYGAHNDTPKAFARMMSSFQNGAKRKRADDEDTGVPFAKRKKQKQKGGKGRKEGAPSTITINPHESLKAFSHRVNTMMPVTLKSRQPHPSHIKETAKENNSSGKKGGLTLDDDDNNNNASTKRSISEDRTTNPQERSRKSRKKRRTTTVRSPSPFAHLSLTREKLRFGDVASAPPQLTVKPKEVLRDKVALGSRPEDGGAAGIMGVEGVPRASGSLARREILAGERVGIVERYRALMGEKRKVGGD